MNVKWLIETNVFPKDTYTDISSALDTINVNYQLVLDVEYYINDENTFYIPYGSVGMVQKVSVLNKNNLGIWYNPKSLSITTLLKNWNKYLLNSNSLIVTLGKFRNNLSYFFDKFGVENMNQQVLFIKPCENDKSFTGMLLLEVTAEDTIDGLIHDNNHFEKVNADTMIAVSIPKIVINEWRFFILNNEIIACTQYNKNRTKHYEEGCNEPKALDLIKEVTTMWQPDIAYSLDICEGINQKYYVMEIGCINCSDLYAANKIGFFSNITNYILTNT